MARNREAYHEYFVEEEFEAGIELVGTEVKSIRAGNREPEGRLLRSLRTESCLFNRHAHQPL